MKRPKKEPSGSNSKRLRLSHLLLGLAIIYLIYVSFKLPLFVEVAKMLSLDGSDGISDKALSMLVADSVEGEEELNKSLFNFVHTDVKYEKVEDNVHQNAPQVSHKEPRKEETNVSQTTRLLRHRYGRITGENLRRMNRTNDLSVLENMVDEAWTLGRKAWKEVDKYNLKDIRVSDVLDGKREACPSWVSISGDELAKADNLLFLPCGLAAGSSITVVATPHLAHKERVPQVARSKIWADTVMVSQFTVELQGLKSVDGEDPPKILHLNPRLKGDWIHRPVIEHNTCYRMQWGAAQRCDGFPSKKDDDMFVDGFLRCERWIQNDIVGSKDSKTTSWFKRFIGREQKPEVTWPFPFVEGRLFILTIRAGVEGYHIIVGGRHVTSFPYRMGFALEDATGLYIKGDLDVHSVYASALPSSHPSFSPQRVLEMSEKWKATPLPKNPIRLFIGILSSTNHFAERMAVRKTWMQSSAIKSSDVVVRFFVALNPRKAVNVVLKKEASYFGDIVILPFMDRYELVVLKTIAICEFGVKNVTASYIMKCDDDTFVRVDTVLKEIDGISEKRPLYMGNLNLFHRPLRFGKWAVTYKEWPEEAYPPYANGPGYIISCDVAEFIVSNHGNRTLRLFKMEDVSMGMWVEQFNSSKPIQYSHSWKFCQYGCMEDYYTAHYQSPRQMFCLWDKIARGRAQCCNLR